MADGMTTAESIERAAQIQAEQEAAQPAAAEPDSFDAFWAEVEAAAAPPRMEIILGVTVQVPTRMTLRTRRALDGIDMGAASEAEVRKVVGDLFGADALDAWVDAGMDDRQFGVVLAWGMASAMGRDITWREAYEAVTKGKAPRAVVKDRALAAKTGLTGASGGTGGRSKGGRSRGGSRRRR
jgi:hypothetical protein